jgi:hypothetical protein
MCPCVEIEMIERNIIGAVESKITKLPIGTDPIPIEIPHLNVVDGDIGLTPQLDEEIE